MLDQAQKLGANALDLIEAKGRLLARDLEVMATVLALHIAALTVGVLGLLVVVGGVTVWVAQMLGAAAALCLLGGVLILAATVLVIAVRWRVGSAPRPTRDELQTAADEARAKLTNPVSDGKGSGGGLSDIAASAIKTIAEHPDAAAGGAFALVSLLGPRRALRVLSGLTAVMAFIGSIMRTIGAAHSGLGEMSATRKAPETAEPADAPSNGVHKSGADAREFARRA